MDFNNSKHKDQERIADYCEKREHLRHVRLVPNLFLSKLRASTEQRMNATAENPKLKCRSPDEFVDNEGVGVN
ncbi:hypothetical protein TSUD_175670 [Trifolium subterraneum]|uniref:Uncharacterized protein n=1 Tax=Trifolium subterraneum TaxID=3900 RepID=A0A2Z6LPD6_TRISU|nr:hypothetical protein TSUD_175670 [Trifolium subterraneum]